MRNASKQTWCWVDRDVDCDMQFTSSHPLLSFCSLSYFYYYLLSPPSISTHFSHPPLVVQSVRYSLQSLSPFLSLILSPSPSLFITPSPSLFLSFSLLSLTGLPSCLLPCTIFISPFTHLRNVTSTPSLSFLPSLKWSRSMNRINCHRNTLRLLSYLECSFAGTEKEI